MNYRDAILKVIEHEGGAKITNISADRGGLTKFGISQKAYPDLDIKNLTQDQAVAIYKRDYWDKVQADKIRLYSIAYAIFDQAVNRGTSRAIAQAQRVLGVVADGKMGTNTISALNTFNERDFLSAYFTESVRAYNEIVLNNPGQRVFINGWMNRISSLKDYAFRNMGTVNAQTLSSFAILAVIGFFLLINARKA